MRRKTDFKYLENMNNNEKIEFLLEFQKIQHYYKVMFDIEILGVFYRKNLDKLMDKTVKSKDYLSNLRIGAFPFYIKIRDKNKKIFRIKKIRGCLDYLKLRNSSSEFNKSFLRNILTALDESIGEYCRYMYIDKIDNSSVMELLKKNEDINSKFIYHGK